MLLKTRGRAYGQAQDQNHCQCLALVYGLSLSPKGQDHHKSESTVSQSDPKIVVQPAVTQQFRRAHKSASKAGQEQLREPEIMVARGPSEPQVGTHWGCLGSRCNKLLGDLGKVYSHNKGIIALRK